MTAPAGGVSDEAEPAGWIRWIGSGAGAGLFAGAAAHTVALLWSAPDLTPRDAAAATLVAAGAAMFLGIAAGFVAWAGFSVLGMAGRATRRRVARAIRFGGFVAGLAIQVGFANGVALPLEALPGFTRMTLLIGVLVAGLAATLAFIPPARHPERAIGPGDALGALFAIAVASAAALPIGPALALLLAAGALGIALVRAIPSAAGGVAGLAALGVVAIGLGTHGSPDLGKAPAAPLPAPGSVVLIVLDTTRADYLGPWGGKAGPTPSIDRLAAEGTVFEDFISAAPWTVPSHATMFTGLYPRQHGAWFRNRRWLEDSYETIAERFAAEGFQTAALFSNVFVGLTNLLQGFDDRIRLRGAIDYEPIARAMRYTGFGFSRWIDKGSFEATRELDGWLAARDPERPFFLFINLLEPHEPYHPPLRDRDLPEGATAWDAINVTRRYNPEKFLAQRREEGADLEVLRALYAGGVRYQDRLLGDVVDVLARHVVLDDVAIVVTADHGENLGEGGRWGHLFSLSEPLVHVPLVIRAPGRFPAGERVAGSYSTVDLPGTLAELGGLEPREEAEGRSLFVGRSPPRGATFAEVFPNYPQIVELGGGVRASLGEYQWPLTMIRKGDQKLVVPERGPRRFYDLDADPAETENLATELPEDTARLGAELDIWRSRRPEASGDEPMPEMPIDDSVREQLEALGYL